MDVNLAAAAEIARQLRLRDMGGIIVIDFIDLHKSENRNALVEKMRELMAGDRAKHTILPLSKFGLMQITRQRVRPETHIDVRETCPACHGTGLRTRWMFKYRCRIRVASDNTTGIIETRFFNREDEELI